VVIAPALQARAKSIGIAAMAGDEGPETFRLLVVVEGRDGSSLWCQ